MATQNPLHESILDADQQEAVRNELAATLSHPSLKGSERCSKLLRFLVERRLAGEEQCFKERTIGHEVFGRPISYETSSDPVVRNAASELRRRLTQYHHETQGQAVAISLKAGSYVPEFRFRAPAEASTAFVDSKEVPDVLPAPDNSDQQIEHTSGTRIDPRKRQVIVVMSLLIAAAIAIGYFGARRYWASPAGAPGGDPFWAPLLASKEGPLISIGADPQENPSEVSPNIKTSSLSFVDAKAYADIASVFAKQGKPFDVRLAKNTDLTALRDRPVILIGGFKNVWTLRLENKFHFQVKRDGDRAWIEDLSGGNSTRWERDPKTEYEHTSGTAYALVSRVKDPVTGGTIVTLTGLGTLGTEGASEFLSKNSYTGELPKTYTDPRLNIQLVISTVVVDGEIGVPRVVASYTW